MNSNEKESYEFTACGMYANNNARAIGICGPAPIEGVTALSQTINEEAQTAQQTMTWNGDTWYILSTPEISYCSQTVSDDKIQFSYVLASDNIIVMSDVYEIAQIYDICAQSAMTASDDMDSLNSLIVNNITEFANTTQLSNIPSVEERGFSSLNAAIADAFGSNYSGKMVAYANKTNGGSSYTVNCTESQTTSNTPPDSFWFAKDTAMTAIVTWVLTGGWSFVIFARELVFSVVANVVVNGVSSVLNNFTAERSDVSAVRTRLVTVDGYTGTQCWAGWTRKIYFFKGDLGWTHDTGYHHNIKSSDYDNSTGLIETGFNNFIN